MSDVIEYLWQAAFDMLIPILIFIAAAAWIISYGANTDNQVYFQAREIQTLLDTVDSVGDMSTVKYSVFLDQPLVSVDEKKILMSVQSDKTTAPIRIWNENSVVELPTNPLSIRIFKNQFTTSIGKSNTQCDERKVGAMLISDGSSYAQLALSLVNVPLGDTRVTLKHTDSTYHAIVISATHDHQSAVCRFLAALEELDPNRQILVGVLPSNIHDAYFSEDVVIQVSGNPQIGVSTLITEAFT